MPVTAIRGLADLFPACAGMNRSSGPDPHPGASVPRVRGDEPDKLGIQSPSRVCSPRARG